ATWGIDSRMALLGDSDTAQAQWSLPISSSGLYNIFAQVPLVANAAGNLLFQVLSDDSNALSASFSAPLPAKRWVYLGAAWLDQSASNSLQMTVQGTNQASTFAVADVIKVSPLLPEATMISNIRVDPSATTANVTWSTSLPAESVIEFGPDIVY